MPAVARALVTSPPYQLIARRVVLPWVLQGEHLAGEGLEIGAGSGAMTAQLLTVFPRLRMVVTDFDPAMVTAARHALAPFGDRASARRADATRLRLDDGRVPRPFAIAYFSGAGFRQHRRPLRIPVREQGGLQSVILGRHVDDAVVGQAGHDELRGVLEQFVPIPGGGREHAGPPQGVSRSRVLSAAARAACSRASSSARSCWARCRAVRSTTKVTQRSGSLPTAAPPTSTGTRVPVPVQVLLSQYGWNAPLASSWL